MLSEFLAVNHDELIGRCKAKVACRPAPPAAAPGDLAYGIPLFLDQLIATLRSEQRRDFTPGREASAAGGGATPAVSELSEAASRHGRELLRQGFTVEQVVHDYGDLCQAVTELAFERGAPIQIEEFRTLNRCLDDGIADAVTEFTYQHDVAFANKAVQGLNERLGFLSHELRNHLATATLALAAIRTGNVGLDGATGGVLDRSLVSLRAVIDRSLADVRMGAGLSAERRRISLADFIGEVQVSASLEARSRGCELSVAPVDRSLGIDVDRDLLFSALGNVLQNAFKFTWHNSEVTLSAYAVADRILIDVEDRCGGLRPGDVEVMFLPFRQGGADKTGLGLGLSICLRSVEANGGTLTVRNKPGSGCVFTISLPRAAWAPPAPAPSP